MLDPRRGDPLDVLIILTCDQRWDALGVVQRELGSQALVPWFQTPNLDRIAAEGARFANAFMTTWLGSSLAPPGTAGSWEDSIMG